MRTTGTPGPNPCDSATPRGPAGALCCPIPGSLVLMATLKNLLLPASHPPLPPHLLFAVMGKNRNAAHSSHDAKRSPCPPVKTHKELRNNGKPTRGQQSHQQHHFPDLQRKGILSDYSQSTSIYRIIFISNPSPKMSKQEYQKGRGFFWKQQTHHYYSSVRKCLYRVSQENIL